jgi:hypothetical protein
VKADDVGLGQEGVELLESNAERLLLRRGRAPDVEVVDLGVKRLKALRHLPPDGAQPHERDALAMELPRLDPRVAARPVPLPALKLRRPVGQPPQHGEHQEQRELGDGDCVGTGGDGHRDPARPCGREVDLVDADPPLLDQPEPGRGVHQAGRDGRDPADEERGVLREGQALVRACRGDHAQLERGRAFARDHSPNLRPVPVEQHRDRSSHRLTRLGGGPPWPARGTRRDRSESR